MSTKNKVDRAEFNQFFAKANFLIQHKKFAEAADFLYQNTNVSKFDSRVLVEELSKVKNEMQIKRHLKKLYSKTGHPFIKTS